MTSYIGLIRKEAASDFGVDFPDFPGCVTAGTDLDDARRMAAEALDLHVAGIAEDGTPLPAPSALATIMEDAGNRDAVAVLVDVQAKAARAVRINVMLPEDVLQAIDRVTRNRSRFLAEAAQAKLRTA